MGEITHVYVANINWIQWVSKENKTHKVESGWEGGDGSGEGWRRIGEYHQTTVHKILKE